MMGVWDSRRRAPIEVHQKLQAKLTVVYEKLLNCAHKRSEYEGLVSRPATLTDAGGNAPSDTSPGSAPGARYVSRGAPSRGTV